MTELFAKDLMRMMPPTSVRQMAEDPQSTSQGLFALLCAVESLAEIVDPRFDDLLHALCLTSTQLYEAHNLGTLGNSSQWVMHPYEVYKAYKRFENVYLSIACIADELVCDLSTAIEWENVQTLFGPVKAVIIHNCSYRPL